MALKALVRIATNEFVATGYVDLVAPDATYTVVTLPSDVAPDMVNERYDVTAQSLRRAATPAEITTAASAAKDATAVTIDSDLVIQALGTVVFQELQKCQVKAGQALLSGAAFKAAIRSQYRTLLG